ncbi:FIST signal transduction protein [Inhella gelatinilytica]|uniref:FIST C-terminal domain-containing protein n=1 Tax=Inhella gelatinilytica TaxID=2795030 RepID=A0A931IRL7_9BURK|nr:FIST N-terminal domain-containing protein [Inhella gelatinilytica]MBH9551395.1 FIST C-terminal domain-containing protein [Inhella gelatinilytica]
MKVEQIRLDRTPDAVALAGLQALAPHLVLVFGSVQQMGAPGLVRALQGAFPQAQVAGCTTAGEVSNQGVSDGTLVITALRFDHPALRVASTALLSMDDSQAAGQRLAAALTAPLDGQPLHQVLVLGQGVAINGSALIDGLQSALGPKVSISGGLAGDGGAFTGTLTLGPEGVSAQQVVGLGFYSPHTVLRHGSFHGWQPFGPERKITRCAGNVLYELDSEPALAVYKRYLGEYASGLPGTGLLFPFEMMGKDHQTLGLIRTILGVDEAQGSLVLAGDLDPDGYLRLMHASTDSLVDGAESAAEALFDTGPVTGEKLAVLVSCVGRKLVMGARVDEEVEAVLDVLGAQAQVTGFYSNGEISPDLKGLECHLHNQTMTITLVAERA